MILWTWHSDGSLLTSGTIDHSKSPMVQRCKGLLEAYEEYAIRFGTNKLVWCFASTADADKWRDDGRKCFALEVPDEKVQLVDDYIWHRISGQGFVVSDARWREMRYQAMQAGKSVEQLGDEFNAQYPDSELWDRLHISDAAASIGGLVSAVVEHPLKPEWVLGVYKEHGHSRSVGIVE